MEERSRSDLTGEAAPVRRGKITPATHGDKAAIDT
jgi:hypothetical protein